MATEAELEVYLAELKAARRKVLSAQSYSIKDRSLSRVDLATINDEIRKTEIRIARISTGGIAVRGITPV